MNENENLEVVEENNVEVIQPEIIEVLDKDSAEQLTRDIQSTTTALYVLLKKAHDTKAWMSLGYKSWTEYIEKEFDFSRGRSYQLLNQANVIEEINNASGIPLYITEREARSIKKRLPEITEKLKEIKQAEFSDEETEEKVIEVLEESKDDIDNSNDYKHDNENSDSEFDEQSEDEMEEYNPENKKSNTLSEDDKFMYDRLLITLKIFESMPNASLLGEKIKKSSENKKELIELAENSFSWITKLLDEIE